MRPVITSLGLLAMHPWRGTDAGVVGLVERDAEVAVIDERLASARSGTGSVLLIDAPAGIVKSSLGVVRQCLEPIRRDHARDNSSLPLGARPRSAELSSKPSLGTGRTLAVEETLTERPSASRIGW